VRCAHNIRLTCICAFADAHSGGKVGAKVALKRELRQQRPPLATFVTKQMSALKPC